MRYLEKITANGYERFDVSYRPAEKEIPPTMQALLLERDRIAGARAAAAKELRDLAADSLDLAANAADDNAAAVAARAGKPIPKPVAVSKLFEDRAEAVRVEAAHAAAFKAVTLDCDSHASLLSGNLAGGAAEARTKARIEVEKLVEKLASAVESAVIAGAVNDWLAGAAYDPRARVQIRSVLPASSNSQDLGHHLENAAFTVRELLTGAALTTLED